MKLLTRDTDYAIRALCFIARHNKRVVSVSELAQELNAPRPFLRKILQILNKKRVLTSFKGQGGGFKLARRTRNIFVIDLIKIFQGPIKFNECFFKKNICPDAKKCVLKNKIESIEKYVKSELRFISIASLVEG